MWLRYRLYEIWQALSYEQRWYRVDSPFASQRCRGLFFVYWEIYLEFPVIQSAPLWKRNSAQGHTIKPGIYGGQQEGEHDERIGEDL